MIVNSCSNILNTFTVYVGLNRNTQCESLFKYLEHLHGMVKTEHPEWMWTAVQIPWTPPYGMVKTEQTQCNVNSCSKMRGSTWSVNFNCINECEWMILSRKLTSWNLMNFCLNLWSMHATLIKSYTKKMWTDVQVNFRKWKSYIFFMVDMNIYIIMC
jgi:hypothetical protein